MDTRTGKIYEVYESNTTKQEIVESQKDDDLVLLKRLEPIRNYLIAVNRDLTEKEKARQRIGRNSPCGCGSGKKFKKCCYRRNINEYKK